jgi:hypothetical protein
MNGRLAAAAVILALPLGAVATPAVAASDVRHKKPTYHVTITLGAAKEVGKKIAVSGKVTGPGAAASKVLVERRYGAAAWKTVAKPKTDKHGKYHAKVPLVQPGDTSFRVVKAASSSAKQGTSKTLTRTVWGWLNLADQTYFSAFSVANTTTTVHGTDYPKSFETAAGLPGVAVYVELGQSCDRARTDFAWTDGSDDTGAKLTLQHGDPNTATPSTEADGDAVGTVTDDVTGLDEYALVLNATQGSGPDASQAVATLMTPRFHCSVPRLDGVPALPGA